MKPRACAIAEIGLPRRLVISEISKDVSTTTSGGNDSTGYVTVILSALENQFESTTVELNLCGETLFRLLRVKTCQLSLRCRSLERGPENLGVIFRDHFAIQEFLPAFYPGPS